MIITTHPRENYLNFVSQVIAEENSENIKIILPTVSACLKLQQIIVDQSPNNACILPKIVPILNIGIESENIYQIPTNYLEPISRLEERIIITNIMMKEDSSLKMKEGLDLANHIIKLFDELVDANLKYF
ncbi:MAG UNVERIFIED_CONTAM: hypothetical protein LVQ98_01825 [Rickettsiaceae bacterium]|jgi:hypothetical protein